jgi:hypothetical protein
MLTFTETTKTERTLSTPEEIAEHVAAEFKRRQDAAPFKAGDRVRIVRRDGVPSQFMVGDVGVVMICDPDFSPQTTLLGVSNLGMTIQYPVQTANLEKLA